MMSCHAISGAAVQTYFEHPPNYYTEKQTCYDFWHGALAETLGAKGELSKEQFDSLLSQIEKAGRTRTGLDCSFSVPKSVSLAMAADETTRADMIAAHQAAVDKVARIIEMQYIGVKVKKGIPPLTRNMVAAEFVHYTARPTEGNNYIPDLDLHSHLYVHNMTFYDGKLRAVDFKKIMDNQKELGLEYRRELAAELQRRGYELELTDSTKGYFELRGFDRDTIEEYSNREAEILRYQEAHAVGIEEAKLKSRTAKDKATRDFKEICRDVHDDLFRGKIKIKKMEAEKYARENKQQKNHEPTLHSRKTFARPETNRKIGRTAKQRTGAKNPLPIRDQSYAASFGNAAGSGTQEFAGRNFLSDLPVFDMAPEVSGADLLVSDSQLYRLAQLQTASLRDHYLQRAAEIRRGIEIDEIAQRAITKLSAEKYAFSVHEAQQRIMAEGLLQNVRKEEAEAALECAKVVSLGRMKNGGKDIFLTTETNLEREALIKERVTEGKGKITAKLMTQEEARDALARVEGQALQNGETDFSIQGGEQAAAIEHILSCQDRYLGAIGYAGCGKTTLMERLNWICQEQGIEIKGCVFSGKAADNLMAESGIESTTIHSFLLKLEKESGIAPPKNSGEIRQEWDFSKVEHLPPGAREIWAVDEAGLVDNNLMFQLQNAVEARGAQLLLLGDPDQLPPVGLGEPLRDMEEAGMATAYLADIRRQKDLELLRAVKEAVRGNHLVTFEILQKKGAYREITDTTERREAVIAEATKGTLDTYSERLLLVGRNVDRKIYNRLIREEYIRRGELERGREYKITVSDSDGKTHTENRNFAAKDRVIFTANDKRVGVMNGTMATIEKIEGNQITVKTDTGKPVVFNIQQYNFVDHSYSTTEHKSQGMTVREVIADMTVKGSPSNRNKLYVDISRAKENAIVFTDNKAKLEEQTRNFAHKVTGKDFSNRIAQMRKNGGVKNNDRYHAPVRDLRDEMNRALNQVRIHTLGVSEKAVSKMAAVKAMEVPAEVATQVMRDEGPADSRISIDEKEINTTMQMTEKAQKMKKKKEKKVRRGYER